MESKLTLPKHIISVLILALSFCTGCAVNPLTGEDELMFFPESQDVEIGQKLAPELEKELGGRIQDDVLQYYIDSVGQKIARLSHKSYFDYQFIALDHKMINAFALPGGYIFITKGMLEKLESEAQLAAILAHEISHVVARDTMNRISNEMGAQILFHTAAMAADGLPADAWRAAIVARQIIALKYSRSDERQADLSGLQYMVRAGYNPYGMVETMEILERLDKDNPVEFLSTHPSPENRIGYQIRTIQTRYYRHAGLIIGKDLYRTAVLNQLEQPYAGPPSPE